MLRKRKHKGISKADAKKMLRRVRKGLPYYNDFIWGDQTRKPETKPEARQEAKREAKQEAKWKAS